MTIRPHRLCAPPIDLSLFDGSPDLMCVRDMQGRLIRVNRAWQDTLGLPVEEVVDTPLLPLIHPADVPATILHMGEADRGHAVVNFVNRYRRRDGSYRYMEWRAQRLGEVILGRARDITTLRLHDHERVLARQSLSETLADIAGHVSVPAADILDAMRSLNQTALTPVQDALMRRIGRSVETLGDLVAQMIEREREAAWAAFLPMLEHRRPNPEPAIEVRFRPAAPDRADPPSGDAVAPLSASRRPCRVATGDRPNPVMMCFLPRWRLP
jgi:PAS domain S-box-containing protein